MQTDLEYTQLEFLAQYTLIKTFLTAGKHPSNNINTILVSGQPGAGKTVYEAKLSEESIIIDNDEFRRFHPRIKEIERLDAENYVERTQGFANEITKKLINDLAKQKYNLVIEGTLRTATVPIQTCNTLKENGYKVNLVVVACDACQSWESTIKRAKSMLVNNQKPRLVPIDKYNYNIKNIVNNLKIIREENCFDSILIVSREGNVLNADNKNPEDALSDVLNIEKWNNNKDKYENEYLQYKINIIQKELDDRDL